MFGVASNSIRCRGGCFFEFLLVWEGYIVSCDGRSVLLSVAAIICFNNGGEFVLGDVESFFSFEESVSSGLFSGEAILQCAGGGF